MTPRAPKLFGSGALIRKRKVPAFLGTPVIRAQTGFWGGGEHRGSVVFLTFNPGGSFAQSSMNAPVGSTPKQLTVYEGKSRPSVGSWPFTLTRTSAEYLAPTVATGRLS